MVFGAETYSVLVVSNQHRFNEAMTPMLPPSEYYPVCFSPSISAARRELLSRNYDFVIINDNLQKAISEMERILAGEQIEKQQRRCEN